MQFFICALLLMLGVTMPAVAQIVTNSNVFVPVATPTLEEGAVIALPILIGIVAGWALRRRNKK